ncbi:MAG: hypothetical protein L3J59_10360 [Methylococcaceae bacterium]|nr:hypothetical protein [Methylococcaceae bacterium]
MKKNTFFKIPFTVLLLSTTLYTSAKSYTPPVMPLQNYEEFYYEIGAGTDFRLKGGVEVPQELQMVRDFVLLTGDGFDPRESIKATLKGILDNLIAGFKGKIKGMLSLDKISAVLGLLPGNVICSANPTACQLNENYTIRAEERERFQRQFYEKIEAELGDTRGKLDGWLRAGKANNVIKVMNEAKKTGEKDLEMVVGKIREFEGKEGIKWLGGVMAGGDGQPPIRPIADTAKAGFNILLGRSVTNGSKATGDDPILHYWDTPEEAGKWLTEVVGEYRPDINNVHTQSAISGDKKGVDDGDLGKGGEDVVVTTAFMNSDMTTPALGLTPKIRKESITIQSKITALVNSSTKPTQAQLTEMMGKSGSTILTPNIINILKNSPLDEVLIKQLSDDAALANTIRYAMESRRILLAGRNDTHIAAYDVALEEIDTRAARLKEYIEDTLFERKVSKELLADTLSIIYTHDRESRNDGIYSTPTRIRPSVKDGVIKTN